MARLILVEQLEHGISGVTLNRPDRRNALNIELLQALHAEIEALAGNTANRIAILRGAGLVFSSGLDLHEASDDSLIEKSAESVERVLNLLRTTPLITIAAVQGGAFAGGAGLMGACDVVVAADDAKIGFPEARRGLLPALICSVLRHRVREGDLRELFLTGEPIDAARAQQVGLVQHVTSADRLLDEALGVARSVIGGGPETIRHTKALLNALFQESNKPAGPGLAEIHLQARRSDEAREGLAAFAEKRKANWQINQ